jgi:Domain of unknown function (DUF4328)
VPSGYRRLSPRARWATNVLAALVVADVLAVLVGAHGRALLDRPVVTETQLDAFVDRQALVGLVQLGLYMAAIVVFIRWFSLAYRNLRPLVTELRFGTGWAIGAWFVPILNLVRPKAIANDIWRASEPGADESWRQGRAPGFLGLWWAVFLLAGVVDRVSSRGYVEAETVEELSSATGVFMLADGLSVVAGVLAILVVRRLTARQELHARRVALAYV